MGQAAGHSVGHSVAELRAVAAGPARPVDQSSPGRVARRVQATAEPRLLGLQAAATYLGIKPWSVRELTWAGTLRPVKLGTLRRLLYDKADLDALIERGKQ